MIKISKPPAILQGRGRTKRAKHCADYDRAPANYDAGAETFRFNATLYSDPTVKQALIEAHHGKCCFCERKIGREGNVEQFCPKASFCQGEGFPLGRPGCYRLAYEWDNLLPVCPICNQRHKGNRFPLADPANRAGSHHSNVAQEEPLLIHPAEEDPAAFIGFRQEVIYAIGSNRRGTETIKGLGLNRENLSEERRDHLDRLVYLRKVLNQEEKLGGNAEGRRVLEEARALLQHATLDTAKFTAMTRAAAAVDFR